MFEAFLHYISGEKRYSPNTRLAYEQDILQCQAYLAAHYEISDWAEVTHFHLRSWMVSLVEQSLSPRSINRKLSALKTFYRFLRKRGYVQESPLNKINPPRSGKRLPAFVRASELQQLFSSSVFNDEFSGMRDRLMMSLLYQAGLRRAELISLKTTDILLQDQLIKVQGKGAKERWVPFGGELKVEIRRYLDALQASFPDREPDAFLLTDRGAALNPGFVYRKVKDYLSLVTSSDKKSPHVMRHSFATHLSDQGADLNAIKSLLGHASLAATQVYMHNSIEKLKSVYKQAHPKAEQEP